MRLPFPYRIFLVALCVVLAASGISFSARANIAIAVTFTDVDPNSTSPYAVAIYELANRGIVRGYDDGSGRFGPLDPILRAQVAGIVVRALNWSNEQGQANFSDQGSIDNDLWNSVRVLADRNVARGFGDGTFRPLQSVAQVQAVSFITRALVQNGTWAVQNDDGMRYPDVPASSGARTDIITYDHYAGLIPFARSTGAGGWSTWATEANRQDVSLTVWNALKQSSPMSPTGKCGEDTLHWHPAVVNGCATGHDHGDAPPAWVNGSRWMPMFQHAGNTPNENVLKHTSFKGFTLRNGSTDIYIIAHLDSHPQGQQTRFHSYQAWARDGSGAVSHWDLWLDFGQGDNALPNIRPVDSCGTTQSIRPIIQVNYPECPLVLENWYSRAGTPLWGWDFGFNLKSQYYNGPKQGQSSPADLNRISEWLPTGQINDIRRIEYSWYASRSNQRGTFYSTQWGNIVSGPNDPQCGTTRTVGGKAYTVLCIEEYIAPSFNTDIKFPGNAEQTQYDIPGVILPN